MPNLRPLAAVQIGDMLAKEDAALGFPVVKLDLNFKFDFHDSCSL
jgi:hypothetical protein